MKLLITEATEAKILQVTEVLMLINEADMSSDPLLCNIIDEIETDLANAERIEGEIYVYD